MLLAPCSQSAVPNIWLTLLVKGICRIDVAYPLMRSLGLQASYYYVLGNLLLGILSGPYSQIMD